MGSEEERHKRIAGAAFLWTLVGVAVATVVLWGVVSLRMEAREMRRSLADQEVSSRP